MMIIRVCLLALAVAALGCSSQPKTPAHMKYPQTPEEARTMLTVGQEVSLGYYTEKPQILSGGYKYGGKGLSITGVVESLDDTSVTILGQRIPYADISSVMIPLTEKERAKKTAGDVIWGILTFPLRLVGILLGAQSGD